jgi:sialic acid synthase SpsE
MNLAFIDTLRYAFGVPVGLSDHTENSLAAAVGVSKGVTWIEKHFTLDRKSPGFDHAYAMEPSFLKQYISDVRDCESGCRSQLKKIQDPEAQVKSRARRGLYAARDIGAGEMLEMEDILIVRPEGPLVPADVIQVIGRVAERAIHQYEPLSYDLLR